MRANMWKVASCCFALFGMILSLPASSLSDEVAAAEIDRSALSAAGGEASSTAAPVEAMPYNPDADVWPAGVEVEAEAAGPLPDVQGAAPLSAEARLNTLLRDVESVKQSYESAAYSAYVQSNALEAARAQMYVPKEAFIQSPNDPNYPGKYSTNAQDTNLGAGIRVAGTPVIFRAALAGNIQSWYDTGVVATGATFDPSGIAPGGSAALGAGQFDMVEFQGQLKLDLEVEMNDWEQAQAFLDTKFEDGDLVIRQAFGHVVLTNVNVLAGSYWTGWADEGTLPKSLNGPDSFPTGSHSDAKIPQIRLAFPAQSGWMGSIAIQQPTPGPMDLTPTDEVTLRRFPDLAARLRFFDGDYSSFSVGGYTSVLGRDNVNSGTSFKGGWGLSSATRFRVGEDGALMAGVVGGKGITGSIFGLSDAFSAGTQANGSFVTLGSFGAYVGGQRQWSDSLISTVAYGFADSEAFKAVPHTRSHNVWVNTVYQITKGFTTGLQYDYGRHIGVGGSGTDHRVTLIVAVTAGADDNSDVATQSGGGEGSRTSSSYIAPLAPDAMPPLGMQRQGPPSPSQTVPMPQFRPTAPAGGGTPYRFPHM